MTAGEGGSLDFPTSFDRVSAWARENRIPVSEARRRFAQYAVLRGVASSRLLC